MKNTVTQLALLMTISTFTLVACSTNTQNQNTGIGAVTGGVVGGLAGSAIGGGAAIAVGVVAGALLGGFIGHSMDYTDHHHMTEAMDNQTNQPTTWTNSKTGAQYTVTPTSDVMAYRGHNYCRKFYTSAMINGKHKTAHGVACKEANGKWASVK